MKIVGLSFSPRPDGNTMILLDQVLKGAQHENADVDIVSIAGKNIQPCDGCNSCRHTGTCHIQDDDVPAILEKMLAADGLVFGTPVYFYNMTGQAKSVIDRTFSLNQPDRNLANKVGGVVALAGSLGLVDALKDFYFYMITRQILPAGFVAAYAGARGEIKKKEKAMLQAYTLGQQIVHMVEQKFIYPKEFPGTHIAFGTHTH
jgi:multimeric flavodoxin WrbA